MKKKYNITVNGNQYSVEVEEVKSEVSHVVTPKSESVTSAPEAKAPTSAPKSNHSSSKGKKIISPMPASIISIAVNVGDQVKSGQVLLVFESMKMQNDITTPVDGAVSAINIAVGSVVSAGDLLMTIE